MARPPAALPAVRVNPRGPEAFGRCHVILRGCARSYHVQDFPGPASIKCVVQGEGFWTTPERRFRVDGGGWLFLNGGQRYSLDIEARQEVETFCLFFRDGALEQARRSTMASQVCQLDDPGWTGPPLELAETLRPHGGAVTQALRVAWNATVRGGEPLELEGLVLDAALALVAAGATLRERADALEAVRPATRAEILRRVLRARDFAEAQLGAQLALSDLARAACLSPFHFHRCFKAVLAETPRDYLTRRRLERAADELSTGVRPVGEVATALGFASPASFATMFRRRFGMSPREWRVLRRGRRPAWIEEPPARATISQAH